MSLRARLTLGLVVLAAVGLAIAGFATYGALRAFLVDRVDDQLSDALRRPAITARATLLPAGAYLEVRNGRGDVVRRQEAFLAGAVTPDLPERLPLGAFTTDATSGGTQFRAAAERVANGNTVVIALPLEEVHRTLRRLVVIELVVAGAVLVGLAALGWWLVGLGLRPLDRMGSTADAIAQGDLSRRVEPATDATEVGRLGLALNSMLAQIEHAFAERDATEARLRQFVADASHELRTPLTSIRGYAELFRRGADRNPEDLAKAMRRIEEEAVRMGVLVDDLLLLARLDQGRPLEQSPVDLSGLARDAVDDALAADPQRRLTLNSNRGVTVLGDEATLRQVLANLLANAFVHTDDGTAVRVDVHRSGHDAVIEVADDGPGLNATEAAHAFEQFWRTDGARTRSTGGAGLGLSIVRAIAVAHGGEVELDTEPGRGATFRVRLPAR